MGVLHWQTGEVRQPLKTMNEGGAGLIVEAAAHASDALLDLLACTTLNRPGSSGDSIPCKDQSHGTTLDVPARAA